MLLMVFAAPCLWPQGFEVASIRPCRMDSHDGRAGKLAVTRGRLSAACVPLRALIQEAYLVYATGQRRDFNWYDVPIEGAPGWVQSDAYTVEARAPGDVSEGMMRGPMLRALLEDRFQLKIRSEARDVPVYDLTVAKGGARLKPFDGSCRPVGWDAAPKDGDCRHEAGRSGPNLTRHWRGITVDGLVEAVLDKQFTGRRVINRTGLAGRFDVRLSFTPEGNASLPDAGPSIHRALEEQLGLKLVPARGRDEFLVVERVERPSGN